VFRPARDSAYHRIFRFLVFVIISACVQGCAMHRMYRYMVPLPEQRHPYLVLLASSMDRFELAQYHFLKLIVSLRNSALDEVLGARCMCLKHWCSTFFLSSGRNKEEKVVFCLRLTSS
jgi:hypothetical protein